MAARGKKRKRKDGSIASGRIALPRREALPPDPPYGTVPPELLARAITIENKHIPIDPAARRVLEEQIGVLDWQFEEIGDELSALGNEAELQDDWDVQSGLSLRAEKLRELLEMPEMASFYRVEADGSVTVDPAVLRHAAETPVTNSIDDRLSWPPQE